MFPRGSIVLIWLTPRPRGRGETSFHGSWMECGSQTAGCIPGRALSHGRRGRGEAKWIRCSCGLLFSTLGVTILSFTPFPLIQLSPVSGRMQRKSPGLSRRGRDGEKRLSDPDTKKFCLFWGFFGGGQKQKMNDWKLMLKFQARGATYSAVCPEN